MRSRGYAQSAAAAKATSKSRRIASKVTLRSHLNAFRNLARAIKFPTGSRRERGLCERETFYAAFGCQRTLEHYRNRGWLSSWVVTDRTVTRRRGGAMDAPAQAVSKRQPRHRRGWITWQAGLQCRRRQPCKAGPASTVFTCDISECVQWRMARKRHSIIE